ncbi:hypothetical protein [Singulisphaera acidiphila]|uniref:hypothetical protein n=1 Tax=Singulisphaera acidiphila TaxID=466153 RepID=UPI0002470F35|nr:hypothetical protein [Singulisphaera acidiphila]
MMIRDSEQSRRWGSSRGLVVTSILACSLASPYTLRPGLAGDNVAVVDAVTAAPVPRLPRDNLRLYHDADSHAQPVRSVDDWLLRRAKIVAGAEAIMGPLPGLEKRCTLDMKVEEELDCGRYVRRLITYASEPGSRVPAYLLIPKSALGPQGKPAPAVLCLHGTDNVVGHGTVVGVGNKKNRKPSAELSDGHGHGWQLIGA